MNGKIITVTLNTAIDVIIHVEKFQDNAVINALSFAKVPAGKGLNVSRALAVLGEDSLVLGIAGQDSKALFSQNLSPHIKAGYLFVEGTCRENTTLVQRATGAATHIRTPGFSVSSEDMKEIAGELKGMVEKDDFVVFSGSLPQGAPVTTFKSLVALARRAGAFVAIDTTGQPLLKAIDSCPSLVKINEAELRNTFSLVAPGEAIVLRQMMVLIEAGVEIVAVSSGSKGVLMLGRGYSTAIRARLDLGVEYLGRKSVGAGDSLLAGLIYGIRESGDFLASARYATACGSANLLAPLSREIDRSDIRRLAEQVQLQSLPLPMV